MIGKLFGKWFAGDSAPALPAEALDELRGCISRDVKSGYEEHDAIVDNAVELLSDEHQASALRPHAHRILAEEIQAHRAAERAWPEITDYDRLDGAFTALENSGIVCRQNFTCCGTCGSAEIWDEIGQATDQGAAVRGYAFFHAQDTESAVEGSGLYLNYGAVDEGEEPALAIAREVSGAIGAAGLKVNWDGTWSKRIGVELDWKRRLPA